MLSSGDYAPTILGDGGVSVPSQYFGFERDTGVYREITTSTSGSTSSAYAVSKRGTKRLRVTDTGGDLYGDWNISGGGTSSEISLPDGTASAPSLSFTSTPNLGLYKAGSNTLGIASGGTQSALIGPGGISTQQFLSSLTGQSEPGYSFTSDSTSGIYFKTGSPESINVTAGAATAPIMSWSSNSSTTTVPILAADGTSSNPAYSFSGESNTGFYRTGVDTLALGLGGIETMQWNATSMTSNEPISTFPGSIAAPGYNFTNSTNSGLSANTAGSQVSMSVGATDVMDFTSTLVASKVPIMAPSYEYSSGTNTNISFSTAPALSLNNGGTNPSLILSSTGVVLTNGGTMAASSITSTNTLSGPTLTATTSSLGTVSCGSITNTGGIINTEPVTTLNGTAGTITCSMPFQGPNYKVVWLNIVNFVNNTAIPVTYVFPTAFVSHTLGATNAVAGLGTTITLTSIVINPNNTTVFNGYLSIIGT